MAKTSLKRLLDTGVSGWDWPSAINQRGQDMHYSAPQISHITAQPGFEYLYPIEVWKDERVEIGRDPIIGWQISVEVSERRAPNGDHETLTTVLPLTVEGARPHRAKSAIKKPDGTVYYADEDSTFPDEASMLEFWTQETVA